MYEYNGVRKKNFIYSQKKMAVNDKKLYGTDLNDYLKKLETIKSKNKLAETIYKHREAIFDILKEDIAKWKWETEIDLKKWDEEVLEKISKKLIEKNNEYSKIFGVKTDIDNKAVNTFEDFSDDNTLGSIYDRFSKDINKNASGGKKTYKDNIAIKADIEKIIKDFNKIQWDINKGASDISDGKQSKTILFKSNSSWSKPVDIKAKYSISNIIQNNATDNEIKTKLNELIKWGWWLWLDVSKWVVRWLLNKTPQEEKNREIASRIMISLRVLQEIACRKTKWFTLRELTNIRKILDQINNKEIKCLQAIQNSQNENYYVKDIHDKLKGLNTTDSIQPARKQQKIDTKTWINTASENLSSWFEKTPAIKLDSYGLDPKQTVLKDKTGNTIPWTITFKDTFWNIPKDNSTNIWEITRNIYFIPTNGKEILLWTISVDNKIPWNAVIGINIDTDIGQNMKIVNIISPITLSLPINGIKNWRVKTHKAGRTRYLDTEIVYQANHIIPPPPPLWPVELTATMSDTTQITRAIAERQAGEKIRKIYKNTTRYKPRSWPTKLALFVGRWYMKDHYTRKFLKMKWGMQRDENLVSAADRHEMEEGNKFNDAIKNVGDIDEANYPRTHEAIDTLAKQMTGDGNTMPPRQKGIADNLFQQQFTAIIRKNLDTNKPATATHPDRKPLAQVIKSNDMEQMSSNVTIKLNAFRDHQEMSWNIADHITKNPTETDTSFNAFSRAEIVKYFKKYQKNPDFLKTLKIKVDDPNAMQELRSLQSHQGALTQIAGQTMRLKVQILAKGEEAYNVKQELTGFRGGMTKIGNRLDKPISDTSRFGKWLEKHPFAKNAFWTLRWITKIGVLITPALLLAPLWPLAIASGVGWMAFTQTLFKKYAHYNKEHIGYQRNQANNLLNNTTERERLMNEMTKMNGFQRTMLYYFGLGKKARDVRQFRDYVMTTHDQLANSNTLGTKIEWLLSRPQLTSQEQQELEKYISEWLARLDHHKKTGQNFLWSKDKDIAEKEYQNVYRLVLTGSLRLDKDLTTIRTNNYYDNEMDLIDNGTGDEVDQIGYQKSRKRFKHRQTEKALLGAVKAWWVAFGLSYLASSLASTKATTDITTDQTTVGDNFVLGKHELAGDNNIYTQSKDFFQNPNTANQTITFNYGWGTDATQVIQWHLTQGEYLNKAVDVQNEIMKMTNISATTKTNLINQIQNKPREQVRAEKGFTNDYLQWMRCIEGLEQTAKALNESGVNAGNITLNAAYNGSVYDVVGTTYKNAGERIIQGAMEYSSSVVTPAHNVAIPIPGFMNTFKAPDETN